MTSWHFAQPLVLLLFLLLPIVFWRQLKQRRGALDFPNGTILHKLPKGRGRWVRWLGLLFRLAGLVCLILAIAGPRWPEEGSRIPTEGRSLAIVLDVSGSMAEPDFRWREKNISRLDATKKVFHLFVLGGEGPEGGSFPGRKHDLVSLVVFATDPELICPLTLNHQVVADLLDKQQPRSLKPKTNIGDAIIVALNSLKEAGKGRKVMVLLSDGEHNVGAPALKPRQAAQLAGHYQVPIYVIDAGKENDKAHLGQEDKVNRQRAKQILQDVARITDGQYFVAQDTQALLKVSQEIDRLETEKIESFYYRRYHEGFVWFALAAFTCFVVIHSLEWTLWRCLP